MTTAPQKIAFAIVAGLCLLAAACDKPKSAAAPQTAQPAPAVTAAKPVEREVMEWDEYPARLEPVEMVEVRARVNGHLLSVHFKEGAEIKKGDLLFAIDPRPYQAELDRAEAAVKQAKSRLELASNELARAERLIASKTISEEEADARGKAKSEAEATLQSAQAALETQKLNLEYTRVTAPIAGRIGKKMVTEGNLVNGNQGQSTLLTTIVSLDPIHAYFDADEAAALRYRQIAAAAKSGGLRDGTMVCELEMTGETGFPHKGTVDFADNRADAATGTLRARGLFANPAPNRALEPGFFAKIRIPGSAKYTGLLVPEAAVGTDQGQKFVYVVTDQDMVASKPVTLGPLVDGLRVVREGIAAGDWVVVNGLMTIRPGMKVTPLRSAPGAAPAKAPAPAGR